jgi:hypothetical protein
MSAAPGDDGARLDWYHAFADAELCVLLEREPLDDDLSPRLFPLEEGLFLTAFDGEERLAAFAGTAVAYAALPGRVIASLLAGQGVGIAVNPGDASRAFLMPASAVDWLVGLLAERPQAAASLPLRWGAADAPGLAARLAGRLEGFGALARAGWLARGAFEDGRTALLVVLEDAARDSRTPLAKAVAEALAFLRIAADVVFLSTDEVRALGLPGLADPVPLSRPVPPPDRTMATPSAPGSDPDRPPRLR